jgi:hypothetical protein
LNQNPAVALSKPRPTTADQSKVVRALAAGPILRVAITANAPQIAEARGQSAATPKAEPPGRTTISTPRNPPSVAAHRRHLTRSRNGVGDRDESRALAGDPFEAGANAAKGVADAARDFLKHCRLLAPRRSRNRSTDPWPPGSRGRQLMLA